MNFLKNKWVIALFIFVVVAAVLGAIFRLLTPESTLVPRTTFVQENLDGSSSVFVDVEYTGATPEFPLSLPIAQSASRANAASVLNDLTTTYALTQDDLAENVWQNPEGVMLVEDFYSGQFSLFFPQLPSDQVVNLEVPELEQIAADFLQTTFNANLTPLSDQIKYLTAHSEVATIPEEEAEVVSIPFATTIESIPVYFEKTANPPFTVNITKTGQIVSLLFYPDLITTEGISRQNLISVNQAVENIRQNQASVVSAYFTGEVGVVDLTTLSDVNLTSVWLEYRTDPATNLTYPFYNFAGTAIDPEQRQLNISVITPAVATLP